MGFPRPSDNRFPRHMIYARIAAKSVTGVIDRLAGTRAAYGLVVPFGTLLSVYALKPSP